MTRNNIAIAFIVINAAILNLLFMGTQLGWIS